MTLFLVLSGYYFSYTRTQKKNCTEGCHNVLYRSTTNISVLYNHADSWIVARKIYK